MCIRDREEIYMGSADWMPRNLDKRVEILFPVEDASIMKEIRHILDIQLADNVKAQILQPDGTYVKIDKRGKNLVCAQEYFCEEAMERAKEQMPAEVQDVYKRQDKKRSLKKFMTRIHELIVYRNFEQGQILEDMAWIFDHAGSEYYNEEDLRSLYYECIHGLVDLAGTYGFEGNLWHTYLTYLLVNNENVFSTASEIRGEISGSINAVSYTHLVTVTTRGVFENNEKLQNTFYRMIGR